MKVVLFNKKDVSVSVKDGLISFWSPPQDTPDEIVKFDRIVYSDNPENRAMLLEKAQKAAAELDRK